MFVHHEERDGLGLAFTDRHGGVSAPPYDSLNLGRSDLDDPAAVAENLRRVQQAVGVDTVASVRQEHTAEVVVVDRDFCDAPPPRADALVTTTPGIALAVRVADCLPIVIASRRSRVIAAVHAGRVGLADQIIPRALAVLSDVAGRHGGTPDDLQAWIGPHVCGACYEVPADLRDEVAAVVPDVAATTSWGTPSLDLAAGASAQLAGAGAEVVRVGGCTRTDPDLYSHRRDGSAAGRLAALVWLKDA
ncbi:MAG TPA: peptidoglycan editing factor PgeF [Candidatus Avipropionibacterium avicola]|uniref:Purine nucleoside phosphorylase n=1 Tax=Candidatus Avipropionibacterium avicola TaxID=2840701 RepID=A0A9D1GVQ3_9ACTN|nr:peptidoglycan editing factor PgeF [Candidatus Avipropionibacterium avicola]